MQPTNSLHLTGNTKPELAHDTTVGGRFKDAVLKRAMVSAITGLPASTLYRKVAAGEFPAPIKLGESASGWLLSEVDAWIAARRDERDAARRTLAARAV